MSENSTAMQIVAEVVVMAGVIAIVYVGTKATKKLVTKSKTLKTLRFSKEKP